MNSFNTKIINNIYTALVNKNDKPPDVACLDYNYIVDSNNKCYGLHSPFIDLKCLNCPHLDMYKWIYVVIDNDMTSEEINDIRKLGLYIHDNLIDVETGLMPSDLHSYIFDVCEKYELCRGLIFATRNAEALEALTCYGLMHNFITKYIYKGQIINDYNFLEQLFNSGYKKMLKDIKTHKKAIGLK